MYDTVVEAAVAYAKHMAAKGIYPDENGQADAMSFRRLPAAAVVKEAEGYKLFLSSNSKATST